jgi:hypothetical protein
METREGEGYMRESARSECVVVLSSCVRILVWYVQSRMVDCAPTHRCAEDGHETEYGAPTNAQCIFSAE